MPCGSIRALLLMGLSAQSGIGKSSECQYRMSGSARQPGLRRHGVFTVIEDDTGNTGSTYTENSIAASTRYTYRVKARKSRGHSPQSSFRDVETSETSANSAGSGAPVITGTAQLGETLTVGTAGISDSDWLTGFQYTYRWIRPINGHGHHRGIEFNLRPGL